MKNKIFKYIFVLASVATTLTACHDGGLFRDTPNDKLSDETIWKSPQLLDEYVLSWYRNCDSGFYTYVTTIMAGRSTSRGMATSLLLERGHGIRATMATY